MTNRLNLMLHCGAQNVDRDDVNRVTTPEATETHFPIPHQVLIEQLTGRLEAQNLEVVNEAHGLYGDNGERYFGLFQLNDKPVIGGDGTPMEAADDFGLVFGLRNSHDKKFSAGLCCGSGVFVCDNLCFSAEIVIGRKHTRHIMQDLPRLVGNALGKLVEARTTQADRLEAYKNTDISDMQADHLVCEAFRSKAINTTRIPKVLAQWDNPNHPEFAEGKNAWRLFNAFTEVYKGVNLTTLPDLSTRLHGVLDAACGIVPRDNVKEAILSDVRQMDDTVVGNDAF